MTPEQVVLGSGGVLGDTWMSGVIAGLLDADGPDLRDAGRFVGTSAGSIVATRLAAGEDLREYLERRFEHRGDGPNRSDESSDTLAGTDLGIASSRLAVPASGGLRTAAPAGRLLRRLVLKALPEGKEELLRLGRTIERIMPEWDPRLSLVGVNLEQGSRIVMAGGDGAGLSVSEAVRASCAIPGVFRPVESNLGSIVDGGVWSPVNLDAVVAKPGSRVFCLYPSGYHGVGAGPRKKAVTGLSRTRVALEAATLRSGGARVLAVYPDPAAALAIGPDRMDHERGPAVASAGYRQGLSLASGLERWLESDSVSGP